MGLLHEIGSAGFEYLLSGTSALDRYYRLQERQLVFLEFSGSLIQLARLTPDLHFPGIDGVDAAVDEDGSRFYVRCNEQLGSQRHGTLGVPADALLRPFSLRYDPAGDRYLDPAGAYPALRKRHITLPSAANGNRSALMALLVQATLLIARYGFEVDKSDRISTLGNVPELPPELQRLLLTLVLGGRYPWRGLRFLRRIGFVERFWPELVPMAGTEHSKDHHPEGDVWNHTLETFRYRKTPDQTVSLALLLHDSGKPASRSTRERPFDGHAELGAQYARRFLTRLEFDSATVDAVAWLVRNHMIPGAVHTLPRYRTAPIMDHELFPALLELYRCDLSSTYSGPDAYYRACRVYRAFLKARNNPFQSLENKRRFKMYVE